MYTWRPAHGGDVKDIVELAQTYFDIEDQQVWHYDPYMFAKNISVAMINQMYLPYTDSLAVCRNNADNKLLAYVWHQNNQQQIWSSNIVVEGIIMHVKLDLPSKTKYRLVNEMIMIGEQFALDCGTGIILHTTIRQDQKAFLRLHERLGYTIRGSYAYKRLNLT